MKVKRKSKLPAVFDKYWYYRNSVQSPDVDVVFFRRVYKAHRNQLPVTFREDFCGTFSLSCEWVKLDERHKAFSVDLDLEPISYGKKHYLPLLSDSEQKRITLLNANVLEPGLPQVDIIAALNFSYFIFKKREDVKSYFRNCLSKLNKDGLFIIDCFGGKQCQEANEEEQVHKEGFSYFWDQTNFDPISGYGKFYIHYKLKGEKKRERVFSYDWRLWTIPELRDILEEVGFKNTSVYWEGTTAKGEGDGVFRKRVVGEECDAWIAYIVAEK